MNKAELRRRLKERTGFKKEYKCARCGSVFSDAAVYREHLKEPHSSDG